MGPAPQRDLLAELSNAVAAYLNTMAASADCLEQTYPDVGGVYRQRIQRLRARVAYQATREAISDSVQTLGAELKDFASVTNRVLTQRSVELSRGILGFDEIIEDHNRRQQVFAERLRDLAEELQNTGSAIHAAALRGLVGDVNSEAASVVSRMREKMFQLDQRLAGTTSIDPTTGLINRRELERQIQVHTLHGSTFTLLLFELSGPYMSDQVLKLAGARLIATFRHREWTARWSENDLAVLFMGSPQLAETRAAEATSVIDGKYTLENGETVIISARARLLQPELVAN